MMSDRQNSDLFARYSINKRLRKMPHAVSTFAAPCHKAVIRGNGGEAEGRGLRGARGRVLRLKGGARGRLRRKKPNPVDCCYPMPLSTIVSAVSKGISGCAHTALQ